MTKDDLLAKLRQIQAQFDAKRVETNNLQAQTEAGEDELKRLQGQFTALQGLIDSWVEPVKEEVKSGK